MTMKRKDILAIIEANPGKGLYLSYGNSNIKLHEPVSKTTALRNAKVIHSYRVSTFAQERPDLGRYLRPEHHTTMIVTFDATEGQ